jgi:hypothetical protein
VAAILDVTVNAGQSIATALVIVAVRLICLTWLFLVSSISGVPIFGRRWWAVVGCMNWPKKG